MAKRIVTRIGDVFCVEIDKEYKCYFQYVANDMTQLNSSVIRVFRRHYPMDYVPDLDEIVTDEVHFYAHTILYGGIYYGIWYKVGKHADLGDTENIMFRLFSEGSYAHLTKSYKWYCWYINKEHFDIGEMKPEYKNADIGWVFPYEEIVSKIKTDKYIIPILD